MVIVAPTGTSCAFSPARVAPTARIAFKPLACRPRAWPRDVIAGQRDQPLLQQQRGREKGRD
jgi:hypothetical protein